MRLATMTRQMLPLAAITLSWLGTNACFNPDLPDVAFRCGDEGACPDGYECMPDGCCHKKGTPYSPADWCQAPADGGLQDAGLQDAGRDASLDAGQDAEVDAEIDAEIDAETDAEIDAQVDAEVDGAVMPDLATLTPTDTLATVGEQVPFTVTLTGPAPSGGVTLTVTSNDTAVATVSASVTVPESQTQAQFDATAVGAGTTAILVSDGTHTLTAQVMVAGTTGASGDLIFTEFLASPQGQDPQFVEIHNVSSLPVDIADWVVRIDGTDNAIQSADLTQAPIRLLPGDFVYGVPNPSNPADIPTDAVFVYGQAGSATLMNSTGSVLILTDGQTQIDQVDFSQVNGNPDGTAAANEFPVLTGLSTQLETSSTCLSGTGNDDAACWCVPTAASPNQANGSCGPKVINEIFPDPMGTDDGLEFIELWGPAGGSLSSWILRWAGTDGTILGQFALTGRMPNNGYFVLADDTGGSTAVPNYDATTGLVMANPGGGIQLVRPNGSIADALGYGSLTAATDTQDGSALVETSLSDVATLGEGQSLARSLDSTDTNDNAADFHLDPTPTPGEPNQL